MNEDVFENPHEDWKYFTEGMPEDFEDVDIDELEIGLSDAFLTIEGSDVRVMTVENLYGEDKKKPRDVLEEIRGDMETSRGNFYGNLNTLIENAIVNKIDKEGERTTLYRLTPWGEFVAEEGDYVEDPDTAMEPGVEAEMGEELEPQAEASATVEDYTEDLDTLKTVYALTDTDQYDLARNQAEAIEDETLSEFAEDYVELSEE